MEENKKETQQELQEQLAEEVNKELAEETKEIEEKSEKKVYRNCHLIGQELYKGKKKESEKEKENYRYSPKKLSYDLYGTTELWADLLKLNGCVSIAEFEPDFIRVYDPNTFKEYLNEIMIADSKVSY